MCIETSKKLHIEYFETYRNTAILFIYYYFYFFILEVDCTLGKIYTRMRLGRDRSSEKYAKNENSA